MGYTYWTPEEDERLIQLYPHHTYTEIGKLMGRVRNSVKNRCYKLGLNTKQEKSEKVTGKNKFPLHIKIDLGWR